MPKVTTAICIYKYELGIDDEQDVALPEFARIISVGTQMGRLFLWAEVIPANAPHSYKVFIRGTAQPLTGKEGRFIGTVFMPSGLVWHIYDSKP